MSGQCYERLGLDRLLLIVEDMWQECTSLSGVRVLDVGCNNGLFGRALAMLGCDGIGIDNAAIDNQAIYDPLVVHRNNIDNEPASYVFLQTDILEFLKSSKDSWDYVLLLSVAHHWETGYAMSGKNVYTSNQIDFILKSLLMRTHFSIYYECPQNEPGFDTGFGRVFLERHVHSQYALEYLGLTVGSNGYLRDLFKIRAM